LIEIDFENSEKEILKDWINSINILLSNLNFTLDFYYIKIEEVYPKIKQHLSSHETHLIFESKNFIDFVEIESSILSNFFEINEREKEHLTLLVNVLNISEISQLDLENLSIYLLQKSLNEIPEKFSDKLAESAILLFHLVLTNKIVTNNPIQPQFYKTFQKAIFSKNLVKKGISLFSNKLDNSKLTLQLKNFLDYYLLEFQNWLNQINLWCNQLIKLNSEFESLNAKQKNRFNFWLNHGQLFFDIKMLLSLSDIQKDLVIQSVINENLIFEDLISRYEIDENQLKTDINCLEEYGLVKTIKNNGTIFIIFNFLIDKSNLKLSRYSN
jgi:hypothetical protein